MAYFSLDDITDGLLKGNVTEESVIASTEFINDLAYRFGVSVSEIPTNPVPYKIKKLAEYKALAESALSLSTMTDTDKGSGADAYELKRKIYEEKVLQSQTALSAEDFRGGPKLDDQGNPVIESGSYPVNISFLRG